MVMKSAPALPLTFSTFLTVTPPVTDRRVERVGARAEVDGVATGIIQHRKRVVGCRCR